MFNPTNGPARETFPGRERVDRSLLEELIDEGTIILDSRRERPLYFDGRFLAARDLTREQDYFLSRQSDLGRVAGGGVVHGLMVTNGATATSISIESGHGVTSAGEIIVLGSTISIDLTNITEHQRLDTAFGISRIPSEPSRNRSGLFIVALRPVEFTANPVASYPTTITGARSVEDGDVVEAVAVTLVPYRDQGSQTDFWSRRARVAREIFVNRATRGLPSAMLPLAMIALDRGVVRWVDPFMVRREVGAEHSATIGFGFAPRALREAHLLQYEAHLRDVLRERATRGIRFAASEQFQCLPPAGQVPAATIDPSDFTQMYFPAEVDVDLSIVPADEVPVLVEESMFLPPIDLTLSGVDQDSTSVQILIPVPRERLRLLLNSLTSVSHPLKPAAPGLVARRKPLESLLALTLPHVAQVVPSTATAAVDAVWTDALSLPPDRMLWYVRRRNLEYKSQFAGSEVRTAGQESEAEKRLIERLKTQGLTARFDTLSKASTTIAKAELVTLLDSPKFANSKLMAMAAVRELEARIEGDNRLEKIEVLTVGDRFADARAGEGIAQLESMSEQFKDDTLIRSLTEIRIRPDTFSIPDLDRLVRRLSDTDRERFVELLLAAAKKGGDTLSDFVRQFIEQGGKFDISADEEALMAFVKALELSDRFNKLAGRANEGARAQLVAALSETHLRSKLMMTGAIALLESEVRSSLESALKMLKERFSYSGAGFGIARFENFEPFRSDTFVQTVAQTLMVPEVDQIFTELLMKELDTSPAEELLRFAMTGNVKKTKDFILKLFDQLFPGRR